MVRPVRPDRIYLSYVEERFSRGKTHIQLGRRVKTLRNATASPESFDDGRMNENRWPEADEPPAQANRGQTFAVLYPDRATGTRISSGPASGFPATTPE